MRAFLRYTANKSSENRKSKAFREYVAEGIRMISQNTARFAGGHYLTVHYDDVIHPKPQENRTGDEIVADIILRAGLTIV